MAKKKKKKTLKQLGFKKKGPAIKKLTWGMTCYRRVDSFVHLESDGKYYLIINLSIKSQLLCSDYSHYNSYQEFLYNLCTSLKKKGLGYRKISYYLNRRGYKTSYSKKMFTNGHVSSILKKGKVREDRIKSLKSHKDYGYTFETELSTS